MTTKGLVYEATAVQASRAIVRAGAYMFREAASVDEMWEWKSGIHAPVYANCRILNRDPGAMAIVKSALGSSIRANFPDAELVVGIAEAGVVWSTLAAVDLGRPHAFIRKAAKLHGPNRALVECYPLEGVKAVLVDDLVSSGDSIRRAVNSLWEEKRITTIGVQSIVNNDFAAMHVICAELNLQMRALASYPQLLGACLESGMLTETAAAEVYKFYMEPDVHVWDFAALQPKKAQNG